MKTEKRLPIVILISIALTLFLFLHQPTSAAGKFKVPPETYHKVKFVYDGDTVLLDSGEKVRLLGINSPEMDHSGEESEFKARAAWRFTRERVKGTQVWLEHDSEKQDHYGRLLAYVFLKNGEMLNELLVREGLAHVMFYSKNLKYRALLLDSQRKAMKAKRGIWSRSIKGKEKFYLGNRNSFRFHGPDCHFGRGISKKNRVKIKTRRDAFWDGFSPCKQCCP
jgi:micrococcal nuclease